MKLICALFFALSLQAAAPVLFFSDLTDGPRTGGDTSGGSTGAYICVWGMNFGSTRGTSTISIGGTQVARYVYWADPEPELVEAGRAKACFQIGNSVPTGNGQNLTLTTSEGTSNPLTFNVRPDVTDSIYFVDATHGSDGANGHWGAPWATIQHAILTVPTSGIVYLRGSPTSTTYYPDVNNITIGGTSTAYLAFSGYPSETVRVGDAETALHAPQVNFKGQYQLWANTYMASPNGVNMLQASGTTIAPGAFTRWVGNDISGQSLGSGGAIGAGISGPHTYDAISGPITIYGHRIHDNQTLIFAANIVSVSGTAVTIHYVSPYTQNNPFNRQLQIGADVVLENNGGNGGGTGPACSPASIACVNGRLLIDRPYSLTTNALKVTSTNGTTDPVTITLTDRNTANAANCNISNPGNCAGVANITFTDIGTGTNQLASVSNVEFAHAVYFSSPLDNLVDLGWNVFIHNRTKYDVQVFAEDHYTNCTSPWLACGSVLLDQPVTTPTTGINSYSYQPVLSQTAGSCGGQACASARHYYITYTYLTPNGETVPAHPCCSVDVNHPTAYTVNAGNVLVVGTPKHILQVFGTGNNNNVPPAQHQQNDPLFVTKDASQIYGSGTGCVVSVVVSGGVGTATLNPAISNCTVSTAPKSASPSWFVTNKFAIVNQATLSAGNPYTIATIPDTSHITFNAPCSPGCDGTYTDSTMYLTQYTDYGWNVYLSNADAGGGNGDYDGWRQNGATPVLYGSSWTEPVTGIVTGTSNPPSRFSGAFPGTVTQGGQSPDSFPINHVHFHDNYFSQMLYGPWSTGADPWYGDYLFYNNIFDRSGMSGGGHCYDANTYNTNGPRAVGIIEHFQNTCYDGESGSAPAGMVQMNDNWSINAKVRMRNDIFYVLSSFPNSPNAAGESYVNGGGGANSPTTVARVIGSNNFWFGNSTYNLQVSADTTTTSNFFTDPGLSNPVGSPPTAAQFSITNTLSNAYGNGVSTGLAGQATDFNGVARVGRYDVGALQLFSTLPTITTNSPLPAATLNVAYSATLLATNGPITWSLTSGTLPTGLTLGSSTGTISGTPTIAGTSTFQITATNSNGSSSKIFNLTVGTPPTITTASPLPSGMLNVAYSTTLSATGDTPITWSLSSGALPVGLSLSLAGGISGTPGVATTSTFTITATNAIGNNSKTFSLTINNAPPTPPIITTTSPLPSGTQGTAYTTTIAATGTSPITFAVTAGTLPTGLALASNGILSGTPTASGTSTFSITATNSGGSNTVPFSLTIAPPASVPPNITTLSPLPSGIINTAYSVTLQATGTAPITWALVSGSLPTGFSLNTSTGAITGTTAVGNIYSFTISATNTAGSTSQAYNLTVSSGSGITINGTVTLSGNVVTK